MITTSGHAPEGRGTAMTQSEGAAQHPARYTRQQSPAIPGLSLDDYEDEDEGDLDAYVKDVVDALPPLTSEQRDLLALIFRQDRT